MQDNPSVIAHPPGYLNSYKGDLSNLYSVLAAVAAELITLPRLVPGNPAERTTLERTASTCTSHAR